ncbi:hypothetical protein CALCODRAFT_512187 [Calocera cornea HHB12733]|uniref:Uncharacterized protein n=1 Tax=Calocera cornea HHB12733 TaxID=1353952 RepID=A0A165D7P5_9BASI|nr:hypothetical protein CALCODRAFT_512187 [Calocera cornea HHB12733]
MVDRASTEPVQSTVAGIASGKRRETAPEVEAKSDGTQARHMSIPAERKTVSDLLRLASSADALRSELPAEISASLREVERPAATRKAEDASQLNAGATSQEQGNENTAVEVKTMKVSKLDSSTSVTRPNELRLRVLPVLEWLLSKLLSGVETPSSEALYDPCTISSYLKPRGVFIEEMLKLFDRLEWPVPPFLSSAIKSHLDGAIIAKKDLIHVSQIWRSDDNSFGLDLGRIPASVLEVYNGLDGLPRDITSPVSLSAGLDKNGDIRYIDVSNDEYTLNLPKEDRFTISLTLFFLSILRTVPYRFDTTPSPKKSDTMHELCSAWSLISQAYMGIGIPLSSQLEYQLMIDMRELIEYENLDSNLKACLTNNLDCSFAPWLSDAFHGRLPTAWSAEHPDAAKKLQNELFPDVIDRADFVRNVQDSLYDKELSVFMQHLPTPVEENKGVIRWVVAIGQEKWGNLFFTFTIVEPTLVPKPLWGPMVVILKSVYLAKLYHDVPILLDLTLVPLKLRLEAADTIEELKAVPADDAEKAELEHERQENGSWESPAVVRSSDDLQTSNRDHPSDDGDLPRDCTDKESAQASVPRRPSGEGGSLTDTPSQASLQRERIDDSVPTVISSAAATVETNSVKSLAGTKRCRDSVSLEEPRAKKGKKQRISTETTAVPADHSLTETGSSPAPEADVPSTPIARETSASGSKSKRASASTPKPATNPRPGPLAQKSKASAAKLQSQQASVGSSSISGEDGDVNPEAGLTRDQKTLRRRLGAWAKVHFDAKRYPYPDHDFKKFYATPSKAKESHHTNQPWKSAWDDDADKKEEGRCKFYPKEFTTKNPPRAEKIRELGAVLIKSVAGDGVNFQSPVLVRVNYMILHGPSKCYQCLSRKGQVPGIDEYCVGYYDGKCLFTRKKGRPRTFDNGNFSGIPVHTYLGSRDKLSITPLSPAQEDWLRDLLKAPGEESTAE